MELRPLKSADAAKMLTWMKDESINQVFATDFSSFSEAMVLEFIKDAEDMTKNLHLACVDDNDNYLGTVSLKNIDKKAKNAEYAISFCKEAHGTGAAFYSTKEILRLGFEELNLERIYLNVIEENLRANYFYQKIGFIYEGTFKKHLAIKGQELII